eukprot:scaffold117047_cov17-Tisochrysis_lutea.AAC.1
MKVPGEAVNIGGHLRPRSMNWSVPAAPYQQRVLLAACSSCSTCAVCLCPSFSSATLGRMRCSTTQWPIKASLCQLYGCAGLICTGSADRVTRVPRAHVQCTGHGHACDELALHCPWCLPPQAISVQAVCVCAFVVARRSIIRSSFQACKAKGGSSWPEAKQLEQQQQASGVPQLHEPEAQRQLEEEQQEGLGLKHGKDAGASEHSSTVSQ